MLNRSHFKMKFKELILHPHTYISIYHINRVSSFIRIIPLYMYENRQYINRYYEI